MGNEPRVERLADSELTEQVVRLIAQNRINHACELILQQRGGRLRGHLRAVTHSPEVGDDLYQEMSLILYRRLVEFRTESTITTFLFGIAHNLVRTWHERYSQRNGQALNSAQEDRLAQPSQTSAATYEKRKRILDELIGHLDPAEREIITLRAEQELSFDEIGDILEVDAAVARKRYERAKIHLADLVQRSDLADA